MPLPDHLQEHGFRPPPLHTKVAVSVLRVAALLSDELDTELQRSSGFGLSEALVVLQIMLAGGRLKMADLADTLVVTRGGVTRIVDRLVDAGYLVRVPSDKDRRVIYAEVTEEATRLIADNQPVFEEVTERRVAGLLADSELHTMHNLLHRLSNNNPGWEPPEIAGAAAE